ncbi:MAG: fructose-6-phosphate aldolase [Anaerolineae bacterium]
MAIFLDSANPDDARRARALGFVAGVTTNPKLMAQESMPPLAILKELVAAFDGPVWFQVTADTLEGRLEQARQAVSVSPGQVVAKIPANTENFTLAARLVSEGITCGVTAVYSPAQVYLAAQAGARYVAPYVSRMTRQLGDGLAVVREMAAILRGTQTEIVAASLKSVEEIVSVLMAGAHHVTVPLDLICAMGDHPLSARAIEEFNGYLSHP